MEAFDIVADEEATYSKTTLYIASDDGVHVDDGDVFEEFIGGVVKDFAHRIFRAAHDAFHAVDGAKVVAAIDAFTAAGSDEDVLVVVGHADDFVGHDLADGEHQIKTATGDQAIDLRRPRVVELALRLLANEFGR